MTNRSPRVALVILAFDNVEYFVRAAESLLHNTDYNNFGVLAVHNPCSSPDINAKIKESMDILFANFDNFTYFLNEENLYHGKGLTKGIDILDEKTKYVVLLNDDVFVPGNQLNWLTKMVEFMEENPNAASVTPALYSMDEKIYWIGKQNPENPHHDFLHFPKGDPRLPKSPLKTSYNNFAICLTRHSLLKEFSLADGPPHYGSDSGFANRIKDKYPELEHWVMPQIKLYHENIYQLRESYKKDPVVDG